MFAGGRMTEAELNDFSERAEFVAMLVYYFDLFIKFPASGVPIDVSGSIPWRDIFRQPIRYPPRMTIHYAGLVKHLQPRLHHLRSNIGPPR
jgi:hypothetical protein